MSPIKNGSVVAFKNVQTGTCIDLTGSDPKNGTPLIGYQYNATNNQHWKLEEVGKTGIWPVYMIRSVQTGTCIDLLNGGQDNGTQVVGWAGTRTDNDHQRWRFVTADPDVADLVMIQNVGTGTYIDLYLGGKENLTKISGWAGGINENTHQQWKVVKI